MNTQAWLSWLAAHRPGWHVCAWMAAGGLAFVATAFLGAAVSHGFRCGQRERLVFAGLWTAFLLTVLADVLNVG